MNETPATTVRCAAGLIGSTGSGVIRLTDCGVKGRESAALEYDVTWLAAHQWVKGGKLPGLYGGSTTDFTPSKLPDGANGFTVRPMWLANGGAQLYVWDMKAGPYGRGPARTGVFRAGRMQRLRLSVTINTPGRADGVVTLDIDGRRVLTLSDLQARTGDMTLTGCFWCVFYGGGTPDYAPTVDQYITVSQVRAT